MDDQHADDNGNGKVTSKPKVPPSVIEDGWFSETEAMWPGQKLSLALEVSVVSYNIM